MTQPRPPLSCKDCEKIITITRTETGESAVRPVSWFRVVDVWWEGSCECRSVRADSEWGLYQALGFA